MIELAEMMIRCSDQKPQERTNDHEQGVRISIFGEYAASQDAGHVALQWLRILTEVTLVICMQPRTLLRVIAQPHVKGKDIAFWQVLLYARAEPADLDTWSKRRRGRKKN